MENKRREKKNAMALQSSNLSRNHSTAQCTFIMYVCVCVCIKLTFFFDEDENTNSQNGQKLKKEQPKAVAFFIGDFWKMDTNSSFLSVNKHVQRSSHTPFVCHIQSDFHPHLDI